MKTSLILGIALLGLACSSDPTVTRSANLRIDTACTTTPDCPKGFKCVVDAQGVSSCQSHEDEDGAATSCPAGFEAEEHEDVTLCKPDDGEQENGDAGTAGEDGDHHDGNAPGAACSADADCAAGQRCEIPSGATTGTCESHGGDGR